ncbi:MAG: aminotransferase class III-fold pyridoxal phosphate-dependent enzyme [Candidatus Heimdallarchaeota archaeon]
MDPSHLDLLKSLVDDMPNVNSSKYWIERSQKALAITTQDREIFPVIDHTQCGPGPWLRDLEGTQYYDLTSGVAVRPLGFRPPELKEFEAKLLDIPRELPGMDFDNIPHVLLAERLASIAPGAHSKRVVFTTSGGRAVEGAMKAAMDLTGRSRFLAFRPAFHGRTGYALAVTASNHLHKNHYPQGVDVVRIPYHYPYRSKYDDTEGTVESYYSQIDDMLKYEATDFAGIIMEPLAGEGGLIVPNSNFVKAVRKIADDYRAYMIADEVQSGLGRTGKWWAIEHHETIPDFIATAKALGGGYALGATIGKADQPGLFTRSSRHSQTVSAEPFQALVSLFMLKEIEKRLSSNEKMGTYLMKGLQDLQEESSVIGDVRGLGLMIGIEIVKDKVSKTHATELRRRILKNLVQKQHLWTLGSGRSAIRLLPWFRITEEEAEMILEKFSMAIKEEERIV